MSAEHNHPLFCCCHGRSPHRASERPCPSCPEHGQFATPYTEQETTK